MIHKSVKIGKYCIISNDVIIGENTVIESFCIIKPNTTIGSNCIIGDFSIIEGCEIKNNVTLQGRNRIGDGCLIHDNVNMKYNAIITSDVEIGDGVFIGVQVVTLGSEPNQIQIPGTYIAPNSYIGGQSIIAPGLRIEEKIILGANSYLREFKGGGTYVGNPAKKNVT